jgi:hypothetical protein
MLDEEVVDLLPQLLLRCLEVSLSARRGNRPRRGESLGCGRRVIERQPEAIQHHQQQLLRHLLPLRLRRWFTRHGLTGLDPVEGREAGGAGTMRWMYDGASTCERSAATPWLCTWLGLLLPHSSRRRHTRFQEDVQGGQRWQSATATYGVCLHAAQLSAGRAAVL